MKKSLPVFALLFNAFVWGVSWWPFRLLHGAGLHPLWATALMYLLALVTLLVLLPGAWRQVLRYPGLWLLAVSAGLTNVCFNWAVTVGDVVRVVLLFYLMPAWSVLLAWRFLGEVPTPLALLRLALAFAGVVLVVLPPGVPLSQLAQGLSAVDLLAVAGGFTFALTNVMLRRLHQVPEQARMLAMFGGARSWLRWWRQRAWLWVSSRRCPRWPWAGCWWHWGWRWRFWWATTRCNTVRRGWQQALRPWSC